jgi:Undecaprenyl-phosphate glucose phosphotransferase
VGAHLVVTQIVRALVSKGMIVDTVAIVGANHRAGKVVSYLESSRFGAAKVVGIFDDRVSPRDPTCIPARGTIADLLELGKSSRIDRIVIALPWSAERRLIEIVHRLKALSADIVLCPGEFALALRRKEVDYIADVPVFRVAPRPLASWKHVLKEAEDKTLSILLLVALFPFMAGIAIAIRASSRGPIIFKQTRHGFNNSEFDVYKFRTMKIETLDYSGARQTARKDARLTGVGAFLRKTSFDELPQLFNVLKGEMSLVGPRPHPLGMRTRDRLCHEIAADYAHRHRMKPGITGWAQVNGYRGPTELPDQLLRRLEYDLHYIENWSLALDMIVLARTLGQIFPSARSF